MAGKGCGTILGIGALVMAMLIAITVTVAMDGFAPPVDQRCIGGDTATSDWEPPEDGEGVGSYDGKAVALARTLWETAHRHGFGEKGGVLIVAAAMQEASLTVDPTPDENDDVGPLQERELVGWHGGQRTREENRRVLTNPVRAAEIFLNGHTVTAQEVEWARAAGDEPAGPAGYHIPGLKDIRGWETMSLTAAIQKVQGSAFPDAYAKRERDARTMVASFGTPPAPEANAAAMTAAVPDGPAGCAPTPAAGAMDCPPSPVEQGMTPDGQLVMRCLRKDFPQLRDIGGLGDRPSNVDRDHQEGRGIDAMTHGDRALGDRIAKWAQDNAAALGVKYLIWNESIWSVERAREGWRRCGTAAASCYAGPNDTLAHRDHVHISVLGDGAAKTPANMPAGTGQMGPPLPRGRYSLGALWGAVGTWSRYHTGVDLRAPIGTPVLAAVDGVAESPNGGSWAGTHVVLRHGDGSATLYAHLASTPVRPGMQVKAGQQIGVVGMTGRTFGPHLHFEHYPAGRGQIGNPYTTDDPVKWMLTRGVRI
ncbi:hypothetical protein CGZ98_03690 [Enemella evansiae]|uniref:M23 family metallopeptidase n=1 Tax=Enemella evansiae TaxID=2016499 RepID=UPI000B975DAE|nr:M23 family metallopeptidase [Enemella evansiae]OYO15521.1 hypothetical protein CGZ98_03690 [Enemella evansiae]